MIVLNQLDESQGSMLITDNFLEVNYVLCDLMTDNILWAYKIQIQICYKKRIMDETTEVFIQ